MLLHKLLPLAFLVTAVSSFCVKDPVKEAREDGKIAVVMLLKGSWPYCQSQAAKLYRWYSLLQDFQNDFEIIFVNLKGNQHMGILKAITFNKFSYYQDTESRNIWGSFDVNDGEGGKKDDVFLFGIDGEKKYISTSSGRSDMGAADASCSQKDDIPVIKRLLQLIGEKNADAETDSPPQLCDDTLDLDFDEIFKRRPGMTNMKKHKEHKNEDEDEDEDDTLNLDLDLDLNVKNLKKLNKTFKNKSIGKGKGKDDGYKKKNMKKGRKSKKEQGRKGNKQNKKGLKKNETTSVKDESRRRKMKKQS